MRYSFIFLTILFCACSGGKRQDFAGRTVKIDEGFKGSVEFAARESSPGFRISLINSNHETVDRLIFDYPLYHVDSADIDHDGGTDILVGLIKATRFDPVEKKRLFILRIDGNNLRPLWLGSRVCQELVTFKTLEGGFVRTIEKTKNGRYAIGLYEWRGFGLKLVTYSHNNVSIEYAETLFRS